MKSISLYCVNIRYPLILAVCRLFYFLYDRRLCKVSGKHTLGSQVSFESGILIS
jgi:hypothetical protein